MTENEYKQKIELLYPSLYRVTVSILKNKEDAADCLQEAVFRGWLRRSQLKKPESFRSWMTRIAISEARNLQRKAARQKKAVPPPAPSPQPDVSVRDRLFQLDEKYRLPLVLFYMEGYSTREIAGMLNVPEGRLRERMRVGRNQLRRLMEDGENR